MSAGRKQIKTAAAVLLLLAFWQLAAVLLNDRLLLVSPLRVMLRLGTLLRDLGFFRTVCFSAGRIALGFLAGLLAGAGLAALAGRYENVRIFLAPVFAAVKSVPVASFIIIALVWLSSRQLSSFISFLIVVPVIYHNVLQGILGIDRKMLEMAEIFRLSRRKRLLYLWFPAVKPYLFSACSTAIGLSWKSGIAAEVIGIPDGSIGEMLYRAKAYLNTADLFAWTVVIVAASIALEKLFMALLRLGCRRLERL